MPYVRARSQYHFRGNSLPMRIVLFVRGSAKNDGRHVAHDVFVVPEMRRAQVRAIHLSRVEKRASMVVRIAYRFDTAPHGRCLPIAMAEGHAAHPEFRDLYAAQPSCLRVVTCADQHDALQRQMTDNVMARHDGKTPEDPERSVLMAFVTESTLTIYRQWVADGKAIPSARIADIAVKLVCYGALER